MDAGSKKMDNSSQPAIRLDVPQKPFSPWLRLAHYSGGGHLNEWARMRWIDDFEIVIVLEGQSCVYIDEEQGSIPIREGDIVFIPPNFKHAWFGREKRHLAVHFDIHANPKLKAFENLHFTGQTVTPGVLIDTPVEFSIPSLVGSSDLKIKIVTPVRRKALWIEKLDSLVSIWRQRTNQTTVNYMRVMEVIGWIMKELHRDGSVGRDPHIHPGVQKVIQMITDHPGKHFKVEELAKAAGFGLTYFRSMFERATGLPPSRYMEKIKIEEAALQMIETERRIFEIANSVGFTDPYHFSRVFKRVMGKSPRAYREALNTK